MVNPEFRSEFQPAGYPPDFITSFIFADLVLFVGASLLTSLLIAINHRVWLSALLICTGAVCYASLHTLGVALTTSEFESAAIMMAGPAVCMTMIALTMRADAPVYPQLRFHVAKADTPHLLWTLIQTVFFWIIFLALLPALIVYVERGISIEPFGADSVKYIGAGLFVIGSILGIWSGYTMAMRGRGTPFPTACPALLVIKGPYANVRNPMVVAGLTQGVSVGLVSGSVGVLIYVLLGGLFWHTCVRPPEEVDLALRFGDEYHRYRQRVKCWLPRLTPYKA